MKNFATRLVLCLLAASFCFSNPLRADDDDDKRHLAKGMTKAQVRKMYGDPDHTSGGSQGETWTYVHDKAKAFLPFVGGPKIITVTFGKGGKVVEYNIND